MYVLKDGKLVGRLSRSEADEKKLYQLMVGTFTDGEYYRGSEQQTPGEEVLLEFENVGLKGACKDVSFQLHRGEILGIAQGVRAALPGCIVQSLSREPF